MLVTRTAQANDAIRQMVNFFEGRYLARTGKIRWCDKSLGNVEHADLLSQLWPEATFVCLVRHCMDVVFSAIEAGRWGVSGYGMRDHVIRNPGNSVAAVAEYWHQRIEQILRFSRRTPERCHLLRYEDLVRSPEVEVQALLRRLGVAPAPGITSWCFDVGHEASGPGDAKIWLTSDVHSQSLGRGRSVPVSAVPERLLLRVNALLEELGTTFAMVLVVLAMVARPRLRAFTPLVFPPLYCLMVWAEAPISGTRRTLPAAAGLRIEVANVADFEDEVHVLLTRVGKWMPHRSRRAAEGPGGPFTGRGRPTRTRAHASRTATPEGV